MDVSGYQQKRVWLNDGAGRFNEVKPGALVLAAVCAAYYVFGLPH